MGVKQRTFGVIMPREVLHLRRETEKGSQNARDTMNLYVSNLQTKVGLLEPPALVPAGRRAAQWRSRPG